MIFSCTSDNSITGSVDNPIGKTTSIYDINTPKPDKLDPIDKCFYYFVFFNPVVALLYGFGELVESPDLLSKPYDFRDNYLEKSNKGLEYKTIYYELSRYGIENNLVNKYYKEHIELLQKSTEIAYGLQYGSNNDQILVNKSVYDDLNDILKLYRNSLNHREIDPILNYLETDLEKYYNKPKYKIAADFEQD